MDPTDQLILRELSRNGRMTMKELGEKVHLTGQGYYLIECHFPAHQELDAFLNDISEFANFKVIIAIQQYGQGLE
ncbi:MAG: AsnC family protein [Bacillota bacterium]